MIRRTSSSRPLAGLGAGALLMVVSLATASGNRSDPFGGAVSFETAAPGGASFDDGDHGVFEQRGAATYGYQFDVPPGRAGMAPSLGLSYSSQAPLRGGVAAGWSFELPVIEIDTSAGKTVTPVFRTTLGGQARLVEVFDSTSSGGRAFRAEQDAGFVRYEYLEHPVDGPAYWIARTPGGTVFEFRDGLLGRQWRLSAQIDPFGNRIDYEWDTVTTPTGGYVGLELREVLYTANDRAGLAAHARVSFTYASMETCPGSPVPKGAGLEFTPAGGLLSSPRALTQATTWVKDAPGGSWRWVRASYLYYDAAALAWATRAASRAARRTTRTPCSSSPTSTVTASWTRSAQASPTAEASATCST